MAINKPLLELLFPIPCVHCKKFEDDICQNCLKSISDISAHECPQCGRLSSHFNLCPKCKEVLRPIKSLIHLGDFHSPVLRKSIIGLKYFERKGVARILGKLLAQRIKNQDLPFDIICPVPLYKDKERKRGYNQSFEIALAISKFLNKPLTNALIKTHETKAQATLNKQARLINISGCFAVKSKVDIENKDILLVDDVITTGATLIEAALTLKNSGARRISAATLAREY